MVKKKKERNRFTKQHKRWLIITGVFLALVLTYDFYVADNIRFYANWVRCGQKPVGTAGKGFFGSGVPHYINQPLISSFRYVIDYKCSPLEAERAGYSANPEVYEMPHLDAIGERWPKLY